MKSRKSKLLTGVIRDKMGWTYKSLLDAKTRKKYDQDVIIRALESIKKGMSIRKAATKFNVPKSVLGRHKKSNIKQRGGQTVLTAATEKLLVKRLLLCAE